jgi:hypothetical protein
VAAGLLWPLILFSIITWYVLAVRRANSGRARLYAETQRVIDEGTLVGGLEEEPVLNFDWPPFPERLVWFGHTNWLYSKRPWDKHTLRFSFTLDMIGWEG